MNTTYTTMNSRKYMLFALLLSTTMVCAQQKKAKPVARKNAKPAAAAQMTAKQHEIFSNMLPNTQKIFVVTALSSTKTACWRLFRSRRSTASS